MRNTLILFRNASCFQQNYFNIIEKIQMLDGGLYIYNSKHHHFYFYKIEID